MTAEWRAREAELFGILRTHPAAPFVTIGGYAVSAWTTPRYSVDLDLVAPEPSLEALRSWLQASGLSKTEERPRIERNDDGSWERWQGGMHDITVDVLGNNVQDRHFLIPLPYGHVARDAAELEIRGLTRSGTKLPVASKETLIALKLQPMRPADIGDIACLAHSGCGERALRRQLQPLLPGRRDLFLTSLATFEQALGPTDDDAQRRLGPRVPGQAADRLPVVRAARRLSRLLRDIAGPSVAGDYREAD